MPTKKLKLTAILNFSKTLKKSPAHLHMVGNVIVKFEKFLTLSLRVFATTKIVGVDLWQPFLILIASSKSFVHPHVALNIMLKCSFCAHKKT